MIKEHPLLFVAVLSVLMVTLPAAVFYACEFLRKLQPKINYHFMSGTLDFLKDTDPDRRFFTVTIGETIKVPLAEKIQVSIIGSGGGGTKTAMPDGSLVDFKPGNANTGEGWICRGGPAFQVPADYPQVSASASGGGGNTIPKGNCSDHGSAAVGSNLKRTARWLENEKTDWYPETMNPVRNGQYECVVRRKFLPDLTDVLWYHCNQDCWTWDLLGEYKLTSYEAIQWRGLSKDPSLMNLC